MDISELTIWFKELDNNLSEKQKTIASEILKKSKLDCSF
jgi:excinuclease ABC subunit A